jgi:hypothetical protein
MRIQRLNVTDLMAGLLVAGATTIYIAGATGADLGGVRARASAVFLLGMLACAVGARRDAFEGRAAAGRFTAALSAAGVLTLIVGITAIILSHTEYLTALMVGIGVLWVGATIRHLTATGTPARPQVQQHHELIKR